MCDEGACIAPLLHVNINRINASYQTLSQHSFMLNVHTYTGYANCIIIIIIIIIKKGW